MPGPGMSLREAAVAGNTDTVRRILAKTPAAARGRIRDTRDHALNSDLPDIAAALDAMQTKAKPGAT